MTARLIDRQDADGSTTRSFSATAAPDSTALPSVIDAFEDALTDLLSELIVWSVEADDTAIDPTS
jgi:ABC-type uncharacterized transport system auxiliary subunit